jgi:hypothetical protein
VNLTALLAKLSIACCRAVASPFRLKSMGAAMTRKPQALGPGRLIEDRVQVAQQGGEIERRFLQRELAGLDLRQVEDVVDDAQQVPGGGVDLFQVLDCLGVGASRCKTCAMPRMAFIGVRISWLMLARKALLATRWRLRPGASAD